MNINIETLIHATSCNCTACAPVPTLGVEMPYEKEKKKPSKARKSRQKLVVGENDLATVAPKVAAMLSEKDKHFAFEITAGSGRRLAFVCSDCGQEFEAKIYNVVCSVSGGTTGCPVCVGRKIIFGINDLASQCPEAAAMWSSKNKLSASEVPVKSSRKFFFKCHDCGQEFVAKIQNVVRSLGNGTTGCPICAGLKVVSSINDLASQCPEAAAMWSSKNKLSASEVPIGTCRKSFFKCRDCGQEFEAVIADVVHAVANGNTDCPVCARKKIVPGINDLASKCPKAAAMWSGKNKLSASEVAVKSNQKSFFKCRDCGQEFETTIAGVVRAVANGNTDCPVCAGRKVVPGINDLASQCPEAAAMWSSKNKLSASEVPVKSSRKFFFKCRDCKQEFETAIATVVRAISHNCTGCYDCNMRKKNAISKPEWFYTRLYLAFAGENGIPNPFFDVRNILGKDSLLGLDFVDHVQKLCAEYNGSAWHGNDKKAANDHFKFEAVRKAGYKGIRVLEPDLEVLDPKYDIVMPEGFRNSGGKYDAEIMEEVGRKVIHLLEEIYVRKASPEIWALNNFKEFEVWYDVNKKELEANARKKGSKGKTAVKMAA